MRQHPFDLRPVGNALSDGATNLLHRRRLSLGKLSILPDSVIVRILEQVVTDAEASSTLNVLINTSTYLRAFAVDEDLWRRLVFQEYDVSSVAHVANSWSWFVAFQRLSKKYKCDHLFSPLPVYSDVLFHKWRCLNSQIRPEWLCRDNVPRICGRTTSVDAFRAKYEQPGRPVVITDIATTWPAFDTWSEESLTKRHGEVKFHAGGFEFPLGDYFKYCAGVGHRDDQPLYIFDCSFANKAPALAAAYKVPEYFAEDLFQVLGEEHRPDYRWLIIGPERSGSSFHKDPNGTAAWNSVIRGAKKWVMFPPHCPPPGVQPSVDEGDVTAPVSVIEWFLNFYDPRVLDQCGAVECVVKEGEIMFVPHGWWHCVLNTKTSIAITQNYVSAVNVPEVAMWLKEKPQQVSGCRSEPQAKFICENFVRLVLDKHPHLQSRLDAMLNPSIQSQFSNWHPKQKRRKTSLWENLQIAAPDTLHSDSPTVNSIAETTRQNESFSFGF